LWLFYCKVSFFQRFFNSIAHKIIIVTCYIIIKVFYPKFTCNFSYWLLNRFSTVAWFWSALTTYRLIIFNPCCLSFHDQALSQPLAIQTFLLQFKLQLPCIFTVVFKQILFFLILKLQLLHSTDCTSHLLSQLSNHFIWLSS
jgi:hypothetical protein